MKNRFGDCGQAIITRIATEAVEIKSNQKIEKALLELQKALELLENMK